MKEITIGDFTYRIGKLNAMQQFNLSRRLLPILQTLIPVFLTMKDLKLAEQDPSKIAELIAPAISALASMSDTDSDYVLGLTLGMVQRKQGGHGNVFAPVWNPSIKAPMFDDIDMIQMLQLVWEVIGENLGSFMRGVDLTPAPTA